MKNYLISLKCKNWSLQKFLTVSTLENLGNDESSIKNWIELRKGFEKFEIRNN